MNGSLFCHPDESGGDLHLIVVDLRRSPSRSDPDIIAVDTQD